MSRRSLIPNGRYTLCGATVLSGLMGFLFCYILFLSTRPHVYVDRIRSIDRPTRECDPRGSKKPTEGGNKNVVDIDEAIAKLQKQKSQLISKLNNETRLLCWVMTRPENMEGRAVIMETWGKRCHLILFMVGAKEMLAIEKRQSTGTSNDGPSIPGDSRRQMAPNAFLVYLNLTQDHYGHLWSKTRFAFVYIHDHFRNAYDWVLKVDDDSFVIVENLRLFLRDKKIEEPFYYGCQYKVFAPRGYASGGPGYVMSRITVDKLVRLLKRTNASDDCLVDTTAGNGAEDTRIGQCLDKLGIGPADTRDEHGRFRYLPFTAENALNHETLPSQYNWFWRFSAHKLANGFDCCSDSAISFHYVTPSMMRVMEYLIYYVHPFSSREIWNTTASDGR